MAENHPLFNAPAPNIPYFTPHQDPPAGAALDPQPNGDTIPKLFKPIKIRGTEFHNRIWLSPLCQYSAKDGIPTPWHTAHLGGIISRGPGLSMVEASAVAPEGRVTPEDLGIWSDEHGRAFTDIVTFAHSQNQKIGIQIAHAGRKATTVAPWLSPSAVASEELGGWPKDVVGPSAIKHHPELVIPQELTKEGIQRLKQAFIDAAKRAVDVGFDVVEIHGAHGYLLNSFISPVSNKRTDEYGGSFENRIRLPLEIVDGVRAVIPETMPLFYRISGSDRLENTLPDEESWTVADTIKYAEILAQHGVDLLDVSSAGNHPKQELSMAKEAFQADLSAAVKAAVGNKIIVTTVGGIRNGKVAQGVLDQDKADAVFVGRNFQKNPGTVWQFAEDLGLVIHAAHQIEWGFFGRGVSRVPKVKN